MALFLPKVVQQLFVTNTDASRVRDNLATAVQPLLDFCNQNFLANADGTLSIVRTVALNMANIAVANVASLVASAATVNGSATVNGALSATTVSSTLGFKSMLCVGEYWNSGYTANSESNLTKVVQNNNGSGLGQTPCIFKMPASGSVVALSLNQAGPNAGTNYMKMYKNGTLFYTWTAGAGTGSGNNTFGNTFAKGAIPFAANDTVIFNYLCSAAGNTQVECHATFEFGA